MSNNHTNTFTKKQSSRIYEAKSDGTERDEMYRYIWEIPTLLSHKLIILDGKSARI
jgi:hypothetical protein